MDDTDNTRDKSDEDFLDRWSRRKLADRKAELVAGDTPAADTLAQEAEATVAADPVQELTDADMPSIESLDSDSDFSLFMSPGVSEQLRTQALRKLFHLPAFNVTDGLNDYDEDYTAFAGLGKVVTQEMKRVLKRELDAVAGPDPVVETEAASEPSTPDLTEDRDEEGDEIPLQRSSGQD